MAKKSPSNLMKFSKQPASSSSPSSQQTNENKEQKYLTTSTSLGHVIMMMVLSFCRRITNSQLIRKRILAYFCIVFVGGLLNDFAPMINHAFMFKVQKTNVLNQWFVKIGWFWTFTLTTLLTYFTTQVLTHDFGNSDKTTSNNNLRQKTYMRFLLSRDFIRLVINTLIWFISVNSFLIIEDWTGACTESTEINKLSCISRGHKWIPGFDISGHTFLLLFSNLVILEECSVMIGWEPFGHQLHAEQQHLQRQFHLDHKQRELYVKLSTPIRVIYIFLTILSLIWDFMLLQTSLFYHTMLQKLIGGVWAILLWFFAYQNLYKYFLLDVKTPKTKL